ncbi:MAG: hypothetical protein HOP07_14830 [Bacteriovoracaceae bacterium]|nr:hypothetical protein [Bacteriovoracaceae bacterium]
MTTIFISGSLQIKNLDSNVLNRIDNIISSKFNIIIGDADGVDSSIQNHLVNKNYPNVTVYCSGNQARNNLGKWPVKYIETTHSVGSRAFFTAKDLALASDADYGFMIWDTKSTGTLSNVIELLSNGKKSVVYINKTKEFINVSQVNDLEALISFMSESAIEKAEIKMGLKKKIDLLKFVQPSLFEEKLSS